MEECVHLLETIDPQQTMQYLLNEYEQYKESGGTLVVEEFVGMKIAKSVPFFVFQHEQLAVRIMGDSEDRFERFANVFFPIACKRNARKIHRALRDLANRRNVAVELVIGQYFALLHKNWKPEFEEGTITPAVEKAIEGERAVFGKVTGLGRGSVILTDQHFVYREIISQSIVKFPYEKITSVEPCEFTTVGAAFFKNVPSYSYGLRMKVRDMSLLSKISEKYSEENDKFRISGKSSVRDSFIAYIKSLKQAHEISLYSKSKTVRSQILQNAWIDVLRCQTLWQMGAIIRPEEVQSLADMNEMQIAEYIEELEELAGHREFSILNSLHPDIPIKFDPEPRFAPLILDGEWNFLVAEHARKDIDDVAYLHQKLDHTVLKYNAQTLRNCLRFIEVLRLIEKRIRHWHYPPLSAVLFILNVILVAEDWIKYIPSLIFLFNSALIVVFLYSPMQILDWYDMMLEEVAKEKLLDDLEEKEEELTLDTIKQQASQGKSFGTLFKTGVKFFKQIYKSVEDQKESLAELQNDIGRMNYRILQIHSLYFWKSAQHSWVFLFASTLLFFIFYLIPFRFIWGIGVIQYFTEEFKEDSHGMGSRFLTSLPANDSVFDRPKMQAPRRTDDLE